MKIHCTEYRLDPHRTHNRIRSKRSWSALARTEQNTRKLEVPMNRRLRRQIRLMQAYIAGSCLVLLFFAVAAMTQSSATQRMDELTVQRINVVDANGTLRLVISNKDRMHPGVIDGKSINRPRPDAG